MIEVQDKYKVALEKAGFTKLSDFQKELFIDNRDIVLLLLKYKNCRQIGKTDSIIIYCCINNLKYFFNEYLIIDMLLDGNYVQNYINKVLFPKIEKYSKLLDFKFDYSYIRMGFIRMGLNKTFNEQEGSKGKYLRSVLFNLKPNVKLYADGYNKNTFIYRGTDGYLYKREFGISDVYRPTYKELSTPCWHIGYKMTLDDAILHAEEKAGKCCTECEMEHKQLAEWLKDYKRLLEEKK